MRIRELKEKDIPQWIELVNKADNRDKKWAIQRFRRYVGSKKMKKIFVIEKDNELIGFMGIKGQDNEENVNEDLNKNYLLVCWIALLPQYRRRGIGSKLLKYSKKFVKKWKKKGIFLGCNDKKIMFYEKNKFIKTGKFINGKGIKENLMITGVKKIELH